MNDFAISVKNLSKNFRMYNSPAEKFKEIIHPFKKKYHKEFRALKNIAFSVKRGESVGLVGRNGAGKSTLLQVICGIVPPTAGTINVNGEISALLELEGTTFISTALSGASLKSRSTSAFKGLSTSQISETS
jgi:ABC-type polysaccharide/polyol phosphate transport system ATPase subunit